MYLIQRDGKGLKRGFTGGVVGTKSQEGVQVPYSRPMELCTQKNAPSKDSIKLQGLRISQINAMFNKELV